MPSPTPVFLFLDSNIFLHFQPIEQIPWLKLLKKKSVVLLVSDQVVSELDKQKDEARNDRVRDRARSAIKLLLRVLRTDEGIVGPGVLIRYEDAPLNFDYAAARLDKTRFDDRILAAVLQHISEHPDSDVRIVTHDAGLHLKALRRDLPVFEIPLRYLVQGLGHSEKRPEVVTAKPKLSVTFVDDTSERHTILQPEILMDEAAMRSHVQTVIAPKFADSGEVLAVPPEQIEKWSKMPATKDFVPLLELMNQWQQLRTERKNTELAQYLEAYLKYWAAWIEHENVARRSSTVQLILRNDGTAPAEDIHLFLYVPDPMIVFPDARKIPLPPTPPTPPGAPRRATVKPALGQGASPPQTGTDVMLTGYRRLLDQTQLIYRLERLNHHVFAPVPDWAFTFPSFGTVGPLEIRFEITAANTPEKFSGRLPIKSEIAPPMADVSKPKRR